MRPAPLLLVVALLCGYGYGPAQDPLVRSFKLLAAHAHAGRWEGARDALRGLEPSIEEIAAALGTDLSEPIRSSVQARDPAALGRELTALAYLAIELKFEWTRRENLAQYYKAKYRIEAARGYYAGLLAQAVRRRDREEGTDRHAALWSAFDASQAALGRPGFFGRGAVSPDRLGFDRATASIAARLREVFPFLPEVKP